MKPAIPKTELSTNIQIRNAVFRGSLMKRLPAMIAVLGLAAWGVAAASANDLYNPDLDILGAAGANGQLNPGPDGWVINATETLSGTFADGADSETFCNVQQPGGDGLFFKPFQGSTNANPSLDNYLTVDFYQDNPSSPGTVCTLSGFAACEANYCGLQPGSPTKTYFYVEFLDGSGTPIVTNLFDLLANGMPTNGPGSMAQLTTPGYTAPANTAKVRAGTLMMNAFGTSGGQSFFTDAYDLESVAPPGSPVITNQPTAQIIGIGQTANFTVSVSNPAGITNVWLKDGVTVTNVPGHISGATTGTLTITGTSTNDLGHYQVLVSNAFGFSRSRTAPLSFFGLSLDPVISITGNIGDTYEVDYTTSLTPPITWTPLVSTLKLSTSPQTVVDTSGLGSSRFYRAVFLH